MKNLMFTVIAALVSLGVAWPPAHAQSQATLRWADVAAAIDRHPAMGVARAQTQAAEAEIALSRQYPNPEFGASVGQGRSLDGTEDALIWGIELAIPIDAPGAYLRASEAARADQKAARFEAQARRLEIERELKALFFGIAIGQQRLVILGRNIEQLGELVEIARLRVAQGEARPMEAARLELEWEQARLELAGAEATQKAARERLNLWLGGKLPQAFTVDFAWRDLPDLPPQAELLAQAVQRHPALQAAALRITAARARSSAERHRLFPEMSVGAFYDRELDAHNYGGMLSIALPLWNWNRGGIARARADEQAARSERELAARALSAALLQAYAETAEALARARSYAALMVPKARRTTDDLAAMYRVGETGLVDLLDARRNLNRFEGDMLAAFEAAWLAHLDLRTLLGGDHD